MSSELIDFKVDCLYTVYIEPSVQPLPKEQV